MNINIMSQKIAQINSIYQNKGDENYGEFVTQRQHALQGADEAMRRGYDNEIVIAILLHDIGHLMESGEAMGDLGTMNHVNLGADYLKSIGFEII